MTRPGGLPKAIDMKNEILAKDPDFDNERFSKWKRALKSEGEDGCGDVEAAAAGRPPPPSRPL